MSLTLRTLLLAGAIIALAIVGIWSGELLAGAWRWPAALLLLTAAWERYRLPWQFRIDRHIGQAVALGKPVDYRLTIVNDESRALRLDYQPDYPIALEGESSIRRCRVNASGKLEHTLTITPVELGQTSLGPLYVRILGRYGLIWWSRRIDVEVQVTVEPDSVDRSNLLSGRVSTGKRKAVNQPGAGYELLMLRNYRYGDSLHTLDWKATARCGKPMVRVFNREQRLETMVLIDCGRGSHIYYGSLYRLHHYVNIAARLSEYAVANGDQVACIAYADRIVDCVPMSGGASALRGIRKVLVGLSPLTREANPLTVTLELTRLLRHRSLIIFLTEMDYAENSSQLLQAVHLLANKHHVLVASLEDDAIRAIVKQPAVQWMSPYRHFAALEYSRGRDLIRKKLLRAGVSVVTATPQHIDDEVLNHYRRLRERLAV